LGNLLTNQVAAPNCTGSWLKKREKKKKKKAYWGGVDAGAALDEQKPEKKKKHLFSLNGHSNKNWVRRRGGNRWGGKKEVRGGLISVKVKKTPFEGGGRGPGGGRS